METPGASGPAAQTAPPSARTSSASSTEGARPQRDQNGAFASDLQASLGEKESITEVPSRLTNQRLPHDYRPGKTTPARRYRPDASIVLIGIRGTGMSTLAVMASSTLGFKLVDADHYFYRATKLSRGAYKATHGAETYRAEELKLIRSMLVDHPSKAVIPFEATIRDAAVHICAVDSLSTDESVLYKLRSVDIVADAVELIVSPPRPAAGEALSFDNELANCITRQFYLLRRTTRLPIIYHVPMESLSPSADASWQSEHQSIYFDILHHGLRLAPDYLAVNLLATSKTDNFSAHKFLQDIRNSKTHRIPVIAYNTGQLGKTSCVFNNILSPVTHPLLLPSPTELPSPALLTIQEAQHALYSSFILDPMYFGIYGSNVEKSLSPAMHNAAFHFSSMPHRYDIFQHQSLDELKRMMLDPQFGGSSVSAPFKRDMTFCPTGGVAVELGYTPLETPLIRQIRELNDLGWIDIDGLQVLPEQALVQNDLTEGIDDSVNTLMRRPDFGGASVTFPHKLQVGKLLDTLTPVARKVGAVNTVIVREEGGKRTLLGDNTDWLGIKACIESTGVTNLSSSTVLILGAGGAARAACHAVEMLGIKDLIIVNRTISKADDLASIFPNLRTRTFESFDGVFSSNGPRYRS
ncbi:unnamed protein product [Parascedosporium putredinis]|uniref:Quinate repressor protein n=1 Tax=Parascedosporium putredinis TaxID=1442378 RepID=A0A9P1MBU0_9PEZI|nr:unnamed protein product [Parascedosporium putredinis]CAI8000241.1 unnamed protein product [Parascedosporium putredinis]